MFVTLDRISHIITDKRKVNILKDLLMMGEQKPSNMNSGSKLHPKLVAQSSIPTYNLELS